MPLVVDERLAFTILSSSERMVRMIDRIQPLIHVITPLKLSPNTLAAVHIE